VTASNRDRFMGPLSSRTAETAIYSIFKLSSFSGRQDMPVR
jgi:hypothetical protein